MVALSQDFFTKLPNPHKRVKPTPYTALVLKVFSKVKKLFDFSDKRREVIDIEVIFEDEGLPTNPEPLYLKEAINNEGLPTNPEPLSLPLTEVTQHSLPPTTKEVLKMDIFVLNYNDYDLNFILEEISTKTSKKELKEFCLEMLCRFEELATENKIKLEKTQLCQNKLGTQYYRTSKQDYLDCLIKLNTAVNNKKLEG